MRNPIVVVSRKTTSVTRLSCFLRHDSVSFIAGLPFFPIIGVRYASRAPACISLSRTEGYSSGFMLSMFVSMMTMLCFFMVSLTLCGKNEVYKSIAQFEYVYRERCLPIYILSDRNRYIS